jgi:hypothetical protein
MEKGKTVTLKMFEAHAPLLSQCEKMAVKAVEGEQMLELQDRSETHLLNVLDFRSEGAGCDGGRWFYYGGGRSRGCVRAYPRD